MSTASPVRKTAAGRKIYLAALLLAFVWVEVETFFGHRSSLGRVAAAWLVLQAVGIGFHGLGLGLQPWHFGDFLFDEVSGASAPRWRRAVRRGMLLILDHFWLLRFPPVSEGLSREAPEDSSDPKPPAKR